MTFQEIVEWARGHLLIEIGAGNFRTGVWAIVDQAWHGGFRHGKDTLLKEIEQALEKGASLRTIRTLVAEKRTRLDIELAQHKR
jgi:hypothetical protein